MLPKTEPDKTAQTRAGNSSPRTAEDGPRFALLCCQSSTRGSGDKSLERAFQSLSLKHHIETVHAAEAEGSQTAFLPGAGAVYTKSCEYVSMAYSLIQYQYQLTFRCQC